MSIMESNLFSKNLPPTALSFAAAAFNSVGSDEGSVGRGEGCVGGGSSIRKTLHRCHPRGDRTSLGVGSIKGSIFELVFYPDLFYQQIQFLEPVGTPSRVL